MSKPLLIFVSIISLLCIDLMFINAVTLVSSLQKSGAIGVRVSMLEYLTFSWTSFLFGERAVFAAYTTFPLIVLGIGSFLSNNFDTMKKITVLNALLLHGLCSYDYIRVPVHGDNNLFGRFFYQYIYEFAGQSTLYIAWFGLTLILLVLALSILGYNVEGKVEHLLSFMTHGFDSAKKKLSDNLISFSKKEILKSTVCLNNIPSIKNPLPIRVIKRGHPDGTMTTVCSNNIPSTKKKLPITPQAPQKVIEREVVNPMDMTMVIPTVIEQIPPKDGNNKEINIDLLSKNMRLLGVKGLNPIELKDGPFITSFSFTLPGLQTSDLAKIRSDDMLKALAVKLKLPGNAIAFRTDEQGIFHYDILRKEENRQVGDFISFLKASRGPSNLDIEPRTKFPIPLGYGIDGKIIIVCMYTIKHLLCTGVSGCGKSNFLHMLIISQMRYAIKKGISIEYYLIDIMGATANVWDGFKPIKKSASNHIDAFEILNTLGEKIKERNGVLSSMKAQDISVVNEKLMEQGLPPYPIIFLVIDEIAILMDDNRGDVDKKTVATIKSQIAEVVKTGRKHGVYLMAFGTRVMRTDIGSTTATELTKIVFNTGGELESRTSSGRSKHEVPASKLAPVGDAFFVGNRVIRFHTPSLGPTKKKIDENLRKWKQEINNKYQLKESLNEQ